jgi:hypothetical protein
MAAFNILNIFLKIIMGTVLLITHGTKTPFHV